MRRITPEQVIREKPILMSAPMVRAILDGRKTMTRRIIKRESFPDVVGRNAAGKLDNSVPRDMADWAKQKFVDECRYGMVGDRLWVRETWAGYGVRARITSYRADRADPLHGGLWMPSNHMPRWASRITLEITGVRVERLQDISAKDIIAEGVVARAHESQFGKQPVSAIDGCAHWDLKSLWAAAWNEINGKGSWESNPWVWAISFKRIETGES